MWLLVAIALLSGCSLFELAKSDGIYGKCPEIATCAIVCQTQDCAIYSGVKDLERHCKYTGCRSIELVK